MVWVWGGSLCDKGVSGGEGRASVGKGKIVLIRERD